MKINEPQRTRNLLIYPYIDKIVFIYIWDNSYTTENFKINKFLVKRQTLTLLIIKILLF